MIKVTEKSKIYIYAPLNVTTGGAELLHQLAHVLNTNGVDTYILYFSSSQSIVKGKIPEPYANYLIKIEDSIEDTEDNIVVIYEGIFDKIYDTKKAQLVLWWLSVDHFYMSSKQFLSIRDGFRWNIKFGIKQLGLRIKKYIFDRQPLFSTISVDKLRSLNALHCYQSEYAQKYLLNQGFYELLPLSDYINTDFFESDSINAQQRENKVLYNPKKGFKYTKKIIDSLPNLTWIPLVGMTRDQLINEFKTSKLYIDFGYHPGKDRIPREAALGGCCIMTNLEGSARFFEDVAIDKQFKIDTQKTKILNVVKKINFILDNYDYLNSNFEFYRHRIVDEKNIFEEQILDIFKQNR